MKRQGFVFAVLAIALIVSGSALGQRGATKNPGSTQSGNSKKAPGVAGDSSVYFVSYFSNNYAGAPDGTVRFINDGEQGINASGDLWAAFYVFDDSQELSECCACVITPDGLLSEDVALELTSNPVTGRIPARGVIKVISSAGNDPTNPAPTPGLRGWATHINSGFPAGSGSKGAVAYVTTETAFADANLGAAEQSLLGQLCYFAIQLGSGQGVCSCTPEDQDF